MKQTKNNHREETEKIKTPNTRTNLKKRLPCLCVPHGPRRKHRTDRRHKLHPTKHDNFIKLRKTLEDTIRLQSDPAGQVINLSSKRFCKDNFKHLNKNLNFVPTQKTINKDTIKKQFEDFLRQIKLTAYFKNNKNKIFLLKKIDSKKQQKKLDTHEQSS